jgi:lysophospholipase L1-like esterase
MSYVLNDPAHLVYHNANGEMGRYFFRPRFHILNFLSKKIFEIKEKIKSKDCEKEYHKLLHCVYWNQVESYINQIAQISSQHGVPVIFLIHPIFEKNKDFNSYGLVMLHNRLKDAASKAGLIPLDLLNAFKPYSADDIKMHSKTTWYDPWHPNAKGHKIIAEYIYSKLMEMHIVNNLLL